MPIPDAAFDEPWRVRCPKGHTGLRVLESADMAYCKRCRRSYPFERLVDLKERHAGRAEQ